MITTYELCFWAQESFEDWYSWILLKLAETTNSSLKIEKKKIKKKKESEKLVMVLDHSYFCLDG